MPLLDSSVIPVGPGKLDRETGSACGPCPLLGPVPDIISAFLLLGVRQGRKHKDWSRAEWMGWGREWLMNELASSSGAQQPGTGKEVIVGGGAAHKIFTYPQPGLWAPCLGWGRS